MPIPLFYNGLEIAFAICYNNCMDKKFHDKIISLLPSKDLINCVKSEKFIFGEEELLKFINDYAPDFNKKLELFKEAANVFSNKEAKVHAKKLIAYNEKAYSEFMRADENCVYEVRIKCLPDDCDEEPLLTRSFDGAIEMIKSWLKCYKNVGAKDNKLSRYTIIKKTITQPRYPRDIFEGKVGSVGDCVLGYRFNILDLSMYNHGDEMHCKASAECDDCKAPCVSAISPHFPHFIKEYDLVAYYSDRLYNPTKIEYGIFDADIEQCDNETHVVLLNNEYIKTRMIDFKDENGFYRVYDAHEHPSYAEIFRPDINDVPKEVYNDYLYAVEGLKKFEL